MAGCGSVGPWAELPERGQSPLVRSAQARFLKPGECFERSVLSWRARDPKAQAQSCSGSSRLLPLGHPCCTNLRLLNRKREGVRAEPAARSVHAGKGQVTWVCTGRQNATVGARNERLGFCEGKFSSDPIFPQFSNGFYPFVGWPSSSPSFCRP